MRKTNFIFKTLLVLGVLTFVSCSDSDNNSVPRGDYENGILISGEGSGAGSGSVSYISYDYTVEESRIFNKVNSSDLGTYLQSISFDSDRAYIVVDLQNSVTVVDRYTFEELGKITEDLSNPRYMEVVGNRGYITNWGDGSNENDDFVAIVDINSFELIEKINVANGPERIVHNNGKLYVSHKGAYSTNNIISIINLTDNSIDTITVKDNPDEISFNSNNQLVVLSEGRTIYDASYNVIGHTLAGITTINIQSNEIVSEVVFDEGIHPSLMDIDNETLYYSIGNNIYKINIDDSSPSTTVLLSAAEGYLYGMSVENGMLYSADASFTDVSKLNIFNLASNNIVKTLDAPLGASKIYFN
ncbi:YncE family protein [Tenacibaculum geojense]|uniref:YncE family protein n=1 Tax=Tenacibaculum geojense TaxID=915352 RepID=A0ABW3JMG5_9FLAO